MDQELEETIAASPIDTIRGPFYVVRLDLGSERPPRAICMFWDESETTAIVTAASSKTLPSVASDGHQREGPYSLLRIRVARPFVARGFIAAASTALADRSVNVYLVSTFSFDFALVRAEMLDDAVAALAARGFPAGEVRDEW